MKKARVILSAVCAVVTAAALSVSALAAPSSEVVKEFKSTAQWAYEKDPTIGNSSLEQIFASGIDFADLDEKYVAFVEQETAANGGLTYGGTLSAVSTAQAILIYDVLGLDFTDVAGKDLTSVLENESGWSSLIASTPYGVCNALKAATVAAASEECIDSIINAMLSILTVDTNSDTGFDYWGISVDTNAQFIEALAPYYGDRADVKQAIDDSLRTIEKYFVSGKGYKYGADTEYGGIVTEQEPNADSTAFALRAYCALDNEAKADEAYDCLQGFNAGGGAYGWTDKTPNNYATTDALKALSAYYDYKTLKESFNDNGSDEKTEHEITDKTEPFAQKDVEKGSAVYSARTADPTFVGAAVTTLLAGAGLILSKKNK